MLKVNPMIISASRRTDIPAFYADWFVNRIRAGFCTVPNPFNRSQVSRVSLKLEDVSVIVFWTRNPRPLLRHLAELDARGYRYYFQYTLLDNPCSIDPHVPPLEASLKTFHKLADHVGPERVIWRYDPIVWSNVTGLAFHEQTYERIARALRGYTRRSVISLLDIYRKAEKRLTRNIIPTRPRCSAGMRQAWNPCNCHYSNREPLHDRQTRIPRSRGMPTTTGRCMTMLYTHAIVRPPGRSYPAALTRLSPAPPVDLPLARQQHAAYVAALRECGLNVITLPSADEHPDAVFVQDPVLMIGRQAIAARSAMPSRQGEAGALLVILGQHMPVVELEPPATLDGGDVLITDDRVYVGLSTRTNREACDQLSRLTGLPVEGIPLPDGLLHLLSGCTYLGSNRLLVVKSLAAALPEFAHIVVPDQEAYAANVLVVGQHAIIPHGYPHTAARVEEYGFTVHTVPVSEFEKRDGGVTCLSLLF